MDYQSKPTLPLWERIEVRKNNRPRIYKETGKWYKIGDILYIHNETNAILEYDKMKSNLLAGMDCPGLKLSKSMAIIEDREYIKKENDNPDYMDDGSQYLIQEMLKDIVATYYCKERKTTRSDLSFREDILDELEDCVRPKTPFGMVIGYCLYTIVDMYNVNHNPKIYRVLIQRPGVFLFISAPETKAKELIFKLIKDLVDFKLMERPYTSDEAIKRLYGLLNEEGISLNKYLITYIKGLYRRVLKRENKKEEAEREVERYIIEQVKTSVISFVDYENPNAIVDIFGDKIDKLIKLAYSHINNYNIYDFVDEIINIIKRLNEPCYYMDQNYGSCERGIVASSKPLKFIKAAYEALEDNELYDGLERPDLNRMLLKNSNLKGEKAILMKMVTVLKWAKDTDWPYYCGKIFNKDAKELIDSLYNKLGGDNGVMEDIK